MKFEDKDGDGVKDAGEPGLAGWKIHLFNADGSVHEVATTDAEGKYAFYVKPGSYTVCEEQQAGWTQSYPTAGADCSTHTHGATSTPGAKGYAITLTSGQDDKDNDFGNYKKAKKSGMKFEDKDGDGVKDAGEPGLAGWKIHLFGANDSDHQVATTDAEGKYAFYVKPGSYTVCEEQQPGWTQSYPTAGADCSTHTHGGTSTPGAKGYAITLTSGQDDKDNDFGNYKKAKKSGMKFEDKDGDGVKDAGEPGLAGWKIHLFGANDSDHQVATTDAEGKYAFYVKPGSYTVCEEQQPGWTQSYPTAGADCSTHTHGGTSTPGAKGYAITLTSGQDDKDNDFGNYKKAKKSGMKFEDKDGDGVKDAGEPGLAGWKIHLFGANDSDHQVATTDAEGKYAFYVKPGSYTVCEEQQPGWTQSYPTAGADCSTHTHGGTSTPGAKGYAITLTSGQDDKDNDFGNYKKAKKSGMKFEDKDGDGVKDAGEPGLAGWKIHLFGANDSDHQVATTDAEGKYAFYVKPGSYTVCEELQPGWTQSYPTAGADCSTHTHGGTSSPGAKGYAITLTSGQDDKDNDFGNHKKKKEGCTPGFWKNHPEAWEGYSTGQTLEAVFNVPDAFGLDSTTLLEALSFGGGNGSEGAARILLRASVAALLNASHSDVSFPRSPADVIAAVNTALASGDRATMLTLAGELDADNNLGCPLGGKAAR